MKNKGEGPINVIMSALVVFFLLYISIMIIGQVGSSSGYSTCVANHTSKTVTGCNLDYAGYQMMNATDKNSSYTLSLSGILPIVLVAAALVTGVIGFIIHNR
jgi:hypothetical protein